MDIHGNSSNVIYLISCLSTLFFLPFLFFTTLARHFFFNFTKNYLSASYFLCFKIISYSIVFSSGVYHFLSSAYSRHHLYFVFYTFLKKFIYLFMRDTEREEERQRGRDTGRGRSRLHAGRLMWDSILGLQDQALG